MKRIFLPLFLVAATGIAHADDDIRDKFNPVYTAFLSTIRPGFANLLRALPW